MRTLFIALLLASLFGGALAAGLFNGTPTGVVFETTEDSEYDPCDQPGVYCGRLRVPGG